MRCNFVDADGHHCAANALTDRECCWFHCRDADVRERARQAQSRGGRKRKPGRVELPPIRFNFGDPLFSQLAQLVYHGVLETKRAVTIMALAEAAREARIEAEIEHLRQLAEAERAAGPDSSSAGVNFGEATEAIEFRRRVVELARQFQKDQDGAETSAEVKKNHSPESPHDS